jgi:hypothetical protein
MHARECCGLRKHQGVNWTYSLYLWEPIWVQEELGIYFFYLLFLELLPTNHNLVLETIFHACIFTFFNKKHKR